MIKSLSVNEYTEFFYKQEIQSILQSPEMIRQYQLRKLDYELLGYFNQHHQLTCAGLVQLKPLNLGFKTAFMLNGPVGNITDSDNLQSFLIGLQDYLKAKKNILAFHIDPYQADAEYTTQLELVEDHLAQNTIEVLNQLGYQYQDEQVFGYVNRWIMVKDMREFNNHQEILASYSKQNRSRINRLEEFHLSIEELSLEDLHRFVAIERHTEATRDFQARHESYYRNTYEAFSQNKRVKVTIAKFNLDRYLVDLEVNLAAVSRQLDELNQENLTPHVQKKINVASELKKSYSSKLSKMQVLKEKYPQETVDIATRFYLYTDKECVALYGGSLNDFAFIPATTVLYDYIIKDTFDQGIDIYNYYGIYGNEDSLGEESPILKFKRGFGGKIYKLVGEYEIVLQPKKMSFYNTIKKVASVVKR